MKKMTYFIVMASALIAVSFCSGCGVPNRLKKEAEENRIQYEDAFRKKVEEEIGPDYTLCDVEGKIIDMGYRGLSLKPRYIVDYALKGKLEHNGEVYDIEYYWVTGKMSTNAFYPEIAKDYATDIGLDKDKIVYSELYDSESGYFIIDSNIRTAEVFFEKFSGFIWYMDIVTEEDLSDKSFEDFKPVCNENEVFGFTVSIYSSDNITNLDDFKEHHKRIGWSDPKISDEKPSLSNVPDDESDVFARYNFKHAVHISYTDQNRHGKISVF